MLRTLPLFLKACKGATCLHRLTDSERYQLQEHLRGMYTDIEKVCKDHNLTIMMAYGSILGAIRHNGFIPWDDDVDLYMPRKDYNIFFDIYSKELPDNYITYAPNCVNGPIYRFGKVIDKNTTFIAPGEENRDFHRGIYVDIFPLENIGTNRCINFIKRIVSSLLIYISGSVAQYEGKSTIYKRIMLSTQKSKHNYFFRKTIGFIFSFYNSKKWYNVFDRFVQHRVETGYMHDPSGAYQWKPIPNSVFIPTKRVKFDNIEANIPKDSFFLLKRDFNDWQYIPSPEERWEHFIYKIKFDNQ